MKIPFNKPYLTEKEMKYIKHAHSLWWLAGDGYYTNKCHIWLEKTIGTKKALLTTSCTSALDMIAILIDIKPGDEVIMPSFNFPSTANAVVLRGGVPVFVDIREDTLNINEKQIENAITPKTRAIFVVHYAGVGCEMTTINKIAKRYNLLVLEDAAHGLLARFNGQYLGTLGHLGAFSFHETKNVTAGEGGTLLINDEKFIDRAEIIREKGTNRAKFYRGQVDKYTWVDIGSSYLPSEITAAFLAAQLERAFQITKKRVRIWNEYHEALKFLEKKGYIKRPFIPRSCEHNGHLYYILVENLKVRDGLINFLKKREILAPFHYIPLHTSPAGRKFGRFVGKMTITRKTSNNLLRLPLFYDIKDSEVDYVVKSIDDFFKNKK